MRTLFTAFALLNIFATGPALAAGIYACDDPSGANYGLLFSEKGAADGFFFIRNGGGPGDALQVKCTEPAGEVATQTCEPVLPAEKSLAITLRLGENRGEAVWGAETISLNCIEIR